MKRTLSTFLMLTLLLVSVSPALAANNSGGQGNSGNGSGSDNGAAVETVTPEHVVEIISGLRQKAIDAKGKLEDVGQKAGEALCTALTGNLNNRAEFYKNNFQNRVNKYGDFANRVQTQLQTLKDKGVDTANLEALLARLQTMQQEMTTLHTNLQNQYQLALQNVCGEDSNFRNQVQTMQQELTQLRNKAKEMHQFSVNELRPELLQIRTQLQLLVTAE